MKNEITVRNALQALEQESRRSFLRTGFSKVAGAAGLVAAFDRFGPQLFGADVDEAEARDAVETRIPYLVYSALGNIIIPVDEDPGWATFEPGISLYGLDVFVRQVLLGGSYPAFAGYLSCLSAVNETPVTVGYGARFLEMAQSAREKYFSDMLTGQFENDGFGDVLTFAYGLALISTKGTFFSNYPYHQAKLGSEFQIRPASDVKTGWDIMRLKGPVGPEEEKALRAKYFDAEELPGVDLTNKYI